MARIFICKKCRQAPSTIPCGTLKLTVGETCVISESCPDFCGDCLEELKLTVELAIRPFLKAGA